MLKEGGVLKEGNIREREMFKGRESTGSTGRLDEREGNVEGKEDIEGRKHERSEGRQRGKGGVERRKVLREGRCLGKGNVEGREARREVLCTMCKEGKYLGK